MHHAPKPELHRSIGPAMLLFIIVVAGLLSGSCDNLDSKTVTCEDVGIHCKAEQQCAAHEAVCIEKGGCGDGEIDKNRGEVCDDGNTRDGAMINGTFVFDNCSANCMSTQVCGNGYRDMAMDEDCDDGIKNGSTESRCDRNCHLKSMICGNNFVDKDMGEKCDNGPEDTMTCNGMLGSAPCMIAQCGDGYMNPAAGEDCDPGNEDSETCNANSDGTGISYNNPASKCKPARCGDGYLNPRSKIPGTQVNEQCDTGNDSVLCNGSNTGDPDQLNSAEAMCHPPTCGDGYTNIAFIPFGARAPEECDNRDGINTKDCNGNNQGRFGIGSCRKPACGDGYLNIEFKIPGTQIPEQCDTGGDSITCNGSNPGDAIHPNKLEAMCQSPQCGDGYANGSFVPFKSDKPEECDNEGGGDTSTCNGNNDDQFGPGSCRKSRCTDGYLNTTAGEECEEDKDCHSPNKVCESPSMDGTIKGCKCIDKH